MKPLWHQNGLKATPLAPKLDSKPSLWHQKWPMKPHCSQPASPTKPSRLLKAWCQGFKISKLLRARSPSGSVSCHPLVCNAFGVIPWRLLKCVKNVDLYAISLFWLLQGRVLAPCGHHGSPMVPTVTLWSPKGTTWGPKGPP